MVEIALWHWIAFGVLVVGLLFVDLFVFHRHARETTLREAALWTVIWVLAALAFNLFVWAWLGRRAAAEFLTGYLIEKSLSMDNVFVFAVIFGYFMVAKKYQYRVLFWGILGAIVLRLAFILAGTKLIHHFEWVIVIFGAFLVYTGAKLAVQGDEKPHPERNPLLRLARRFFPVSMQDHGERFFVREGGRWCITPLFLVLLVVESSDVIFAVDSVPAIFGVVTKSAPYFAFIVFTSNVFAILGLRALYFILAGVMDMFRYLKYGLSAILVFVGVKMLAEYFVEGEEANGHLVPPWASLVTVLSLLAASMVASIIAERLHAARGGEPEPISPPQDEPHQPTLAEEARPTN